MSGVFDRRLLVVWAALVGATAISFALGADHGGDSPGADTVGVSVGLAIAFAKIWVIGMEFMELRPAPMVLRGVFSLWCLAIGGTVITMFVMG